MNEVKKSIKETLALVQFMGPIKVYGSNQKFMGPIKILVQKVVKFVVGNFLKRNVNSQKKFFLSRI